MAFFPLSSPLITTWPIASFLGAAHGASWTQDSLFGSVMRCKQVRLIDCHTTSVHEQSYSPMGCCNGITRPCLGLMSHVFKFILKKRERETERERQRERERERQTDRAIDEHQNIRNTTSVFVAIKQQQQMQ